MISFSSLSAGALFSNLHLSLVEGRLICLTGPNGAGKTTLLSLLKEEAQRRGLHCELLFQSDSDPFESDRQTFEQASAGELRAKRIEALMRAQPDLLLLDEPTNHLDTPSFRRLLALLRRFKGALLVVSHDRRLLREADRIAHLEAGRLEEYGGGWQLYQEQRRLEAEARLREAERLDRRAASAQRRLETSVARQVSRRNHAEAVNRTQKNPKSLVNMQRNRADHTKARLETHHKRLVHEAEASAAEAKERRLAQGRPLDLRPQGGSSLSSRPLITVQQLQLSRGNASSLSLTVRADSRIAVVGPCGSGKSTLAGAILFGRNIASGEIIGQARHPFLLDQQLSLLAPFSQSVVEFFTAHYQGPDARTLLAASGFPGEIQRRPVATLSGGERMRLALAMAFACKADLLLFDEPTNDLDQRAREELERALLAYKGALIVISHDMEFLEAIDIEEYVSLG